MVDDTAPIPNTAAAVEFLQSWPGFPVLSASHTELATGKKGLFESKSFPAPTDWNAVAKWIDARQGKANLYFSVNPLTHAIDKKAERTDIARIVALQVDSDVRPGENQADGTARIIKMFEAYKVPPSLIISSGGGAQAFWLLEEPLDIGGDLVKAEDAKLYNIQLERDLQGDNCHNIDRIMRLPGTINIPNTTKLKKGRKPSVAAIYSRTDAKYPITAFAKAMKIQEAEEKPGAGPTKGIDIVISGNYERMAPNDERLTKTLGAKWSTFGFTGDTENTYGGDRSKALFAWVCQAIRAKVPDQIIANCIMDPDWKIGECAREKKNVDRELRRVIERGHMFAIDNDDDLGEMNDKYAVVNVYGKTRVMTQGLSAIYPDRWLPQYSTFEDFQNLHSNRFKEFLIEGEVTRIPLGSWWIKNKQRRQYNDGLRYLPHHDADIVGDALNLWRGFTVVPKAGDCGLYLAHMRENICSGNEANYQYLMHLMADAVQNRGRPGGVATCLRGGKGTGKGFFIRTFGRLFGQHFLAVTNAEHLTGKFNQHLETVSILFADECFFAGDKKHEQILKVLITEPEIIIEPKGINAYQAPNYLHIFMASNGDWVVPASSDERRYFVLDVGTGSQQNGAYFAAIADQMNNKGGNEALLHLLLNLDLTAFDIRKVPNTEGLKRQKALSRRGFDALIEQVCHDGIIPFGYERAPDVAVTTKDDHGRSFWTDIQSTHYELKFMAPTAMGMKLKEWGCKPWHRPRVKLRGIQFPPLNELRAKFEDKFGPQQWDTDVDCWQGNDSDASRAPGTASGKADKGDPEIPF